MASERKLGRWVVEVILVDNHLLQDILNGRVEEADFDNEEEAQRECDRRERELRQQLGPFCGWQGDLSMLTSLGEDVFCDWLLDAGIDPPSPAENGPRDWKGWYDRVAPGWSDDTRHRFWQGLDQPHFYRVRERPQRKAHAVLEVGWLESKRRWRNTDPECRRTVAVFSDPAAAERCRAELEQQRRQSPSHARGREEATLFEVVAVDWVGPAHERSVVLVQRRAVLGDNDWEQDIIWEVAGAAFTPYVPLRLFGDRAAAEAYRDDILSRARLMLNPFDLGSLDALTSMTPQALRDSFSELNITPPELPAPEKTTAWFWTRWWDRTNPTLGREQIEGIWGLLDRLHLIEVIELPLDQPLIPGSLP